MITIGAVASGCLILYILAQVSGGLFGLMFSWLAYGLAAIGALSVVIRAARR
jgi:hypothetical protein